MRNLFPIVFGTIVILLFGAVYVVLLRLLNYEWWQRRWIRWTALLLPVFGVIMLGLWALGEYRAIDWLVYPGAVLASATFVMEVCLMLSLPVSGGLHLLRRLLDRFFSRKRPEPALQREKRRVFLKAAAAALPAATVGLGVTGITGAFHDIRVYRRPIAVEGLHPDLERLRLLHLSDIHLGRYIDLDHVRQTVDDAARYRPDMVLVTGDVADDLEHLEPALLMIDELAPRLGTFVSVGNHEYFRGVRRFVDICRQSPATLLIDSARLLEAGSARVCVAGIDDPVRLSGAGPQFFKERIDIILPSHRAADFTVLMSHRPNAFVYAAEQGIGLTLAGHTHGGQLGFGGRSLVETLAGVPYYWGHYTQGKSHLYTTAGVGHWFPFRLGCPAEAPVIELRRG
jgi:hypothetical protein